MSHFRALCSTGAFYSEKNTTSIDFVIQTMRQLPGVGFEVMAYRTWVNDWAGAARQLRATGAEMPVVHAMKNLGPDLAGDDEGDRDRAWMTFADNCQFARDLGAETVVLHLWGLPGSDARLERNLAVLPRLCDIAEAHDVTLSIESILCQRSTPIDALARCLQTDPRAKLTLDTAFLAMHDQLLSAVEDPRLWEATAVNHVHIKDLADPAAAFGAPYLHPGEGVLELEKFLVGLANHGVRCTVSLEASSLFDDQSPDYDRALASLEWISSLQT